MARIRVTANNVKAKLVQWKDGTNRVDELVFIPSEVDEKDLQIDSFNKWDMVINILPDVGPFKKIVFVEMLT